MGLYFNFSIVLFYIPITVIVCFLKVIKNKINSKSKFKLISIKRYSRYFKIYINVKVICIISFFSIISNTIVISKNKSFNEFYENIKNIEAIGIITSNKISKDYKDVYEVQIKYINGIKKYKNIKLYLQCPKDFKLNIKYGNMIKFEGEYIKPSTRRNYKGFDYSKYLKQFNIYGTVSVKNIEILKDININPVLYFSYEIAENIKSDIDKILPQPNSNLLKGILLGDNYNIGEDLKESYRISSIAHVLAVSGMHVSYLILIINILFKKLLGKRNTYKISIVVLILYMCITGFSTSIVRASVMGIIVIFSKLIFRENDIWESISISLMAILLANPYLITSVGLQFSFASTIGLLLLNKNIFKFLQKLRIKKRRNKVNKEIEFIIIKFKELLATIFAVQISILPITLFHFNYFGIYFFITNIFTSFIIGIIILLGFLIIVLSYISIHIATSFAPIMIILLDLLNKISGFSKLPYSKIYVATPSFIFILLYFVIILIINFLFQVYNEEKTNYTYIRIKNLISVFKYKFLKKQNRNKHRYKMIFLVFIMILIIVRVLPKNLIINFIDVGQGDSSFIVTPKGKTILIDGGGSSFENFDVGKEMLLPYILDRGYTKIDYMFISHFDTDHCKGLFTILKELKVRYVIIGKQFEENENLEEFIEIINEKNIKLKVVESGQKIAIEKNIYFDILWPSSDIKINENSINNNALVLKLNYEIKNYYKNKPQKFSMIFTGDIEEEAEEALVQKYKNNDALKSEILKVAHHGAKTSSTEEFLKLVKPKIALIGVGKNNLYGHPSSKTIEKLDKLGTKIFRTDLDREIEIFINRKGVIKIKKLKND